MPVRTAARAALQRARFPAVFLAQQTNPRIALRDALHFGGGLVPRTIVHHDHFDLAFVIGRQASARKVSAITLPSLYAAITTLIGSAKSVRGLAAKPRGQPDDDQRSHDDERRRDDHERPEKFFDCVVNAKTGAAHETRERSSVGLRPAASTHRASCPAACLTRRQCRRACGDNRECAAALRRSANDRRRHRAAE